MGDPAFKITEQETLTFAEICGAMTIENIAEIREGVLRAFERGKGVQLSLSGVTEMDLTGLQLLCSAHRSSIQRKVDLKLTGAESVAVSSAAGVAGMSRHTGCAEDVCGSCLWNRELF